MTSARPPRTARTSNGIRRSGRRRSLSSPRWRQIADGDRGAQADLRFNVGLYGSHGIILAGYAQATWANAKEIRSFYLVEKAESRLRHTALCNKAVVRQESRIQRCSSAVKCGRSRGTDVGIDILLFISTWRRACREGDGARIRSLTGKQAA
jgi:hypothetical protein